MTFEPFIKVLAIIYKGTLEEKCDLVYGFFDLDGDNFVTREEVTITIREFFASVREVRPNDENEDSSQIELMHMAQGEVQQCIYEIVDSIFSRYAKKSDSVIHRDEMQNYLYANIKNILT